MNHLETDFIMFNVLLNSDIDTLNKMYKESGVAKEICNDKYFWERKFEHDKLILINYQTDINDWLNEYRKVYDAIIDADDIIKISLIEKERDNNFKDKNTDILHSNDGTILMSFPDDYPIGYHVWFLPQKSICKDIEKLNELKSSGEIHPLYIRLIPCDNNNYKLIYRFWHEVCRAGYLSDVFEVPIDNLSMKEMKNIMIKSLYDSLIAVDDMNNEYLFDDRDSIDNWVTNYEYHSMIKFSRIGMRDTFNYLRKNHK